MQSSANLYHVHMAVCVMSLYVNFCKVFNGFTVDINESLQSVSDYIKTSMVKDKLKYMDKFIDIVKFHAQAKRLKFWYFFVLNSSFIKIFSSNLPFQIGKYFLGFIHRTYSDIFIVSNRAHHWLHSWNRIGKMFLIPVMNHNWSHLNLQEIETGLSKNVAHMGFYMNASLVWLYLICYFGSEVASHFQSIAVTIYQCDWYLFPLNMQKWLPMTLALAQKPIYICQFGQIHCTREIFKRVCFYDFYDHK